VSKRSKRRRGPQTSGAEGAAQAGRPAETGEAGESGRAREAREASGGGSRGRAGEARQASRRDVQGRSAARASSRRAASDWGLGVQLAFLAAVFAVVVLVAELAGAANLGVALGVGQIAFAIAVIYLLVRR
jgi:hypothetical protein